MKMEKYFGNWITPKIKTELLKVLRELSAIDQRLLCPSLKDVFKAFELCRYEDCRIIFLGQDPYPQKGIATGILFGNREETVTLSPSLEVIKECVIDPEIPHGPTEFDITLESWAKQGILMLNSALTCEVNKIGSHVNLWRPFIAELLKSLSERRTGLLYVLFGRQAETFKPYINPKYNSIFSIEHPAYYARAGKRMPAIFKEIDKFTLNQNNAKVTWYKEL